MFLILLAIENVLSAVAMGVGFTAKSLQIVEKFSISFLSSLGIDLICSSTSSNHTIFLSLDITLKVCSSTFNWSTFTSIEYFNNTDSNSNCSNARNEGCSNRSRTEETRASIDS